MAYTAEYDLLYTETNDLHKKATRAIDVAARDVISEDPGTTNHEQRLAWAKRLRGNIDSMRAEAHKAMPYVLDNATISAAGNAATDNDVQFVINGVVNTLALGG